MANKTIPAIQTNEGKVGIGTTNPSYKIQVSGDAYITDTLKNGKVETRSFQVDFPNALANRAIDIRFPNTYINGLIEIEVTSGFSYQNSVGVVKKIFSVGANPNNVIWNTTVARVVEAHGVAPDNWTIGDFAWDATNSKYIIPVYHIVSTGNVLNISIRYFAESALDHPNLPTTTVSALYTATIPAAYQTKHYVYYNDNVGIGTSNPSSKLHIDDASTPYITITRAGVPTWQLRNNYPNNQYGFSFNNTTAGTVPLFIGAGGNIGIGLDSPAAKLDLYSSTDLGSTANGIRVQRPASYGQYGYLEYLFNSSQTVLGSVYTGGGSSVFGQLYFRQHSSSTSRDAMVIKADGKVGIATSSPSAALEVSGSAIIGSSTYGSSYGHSLRIPFGADNLTDGTLRGHLQFDSVEDYSVNGGDAWKWKLGAVARPGSAGNYNSQFEILRSTRVGVTDNPDFVINRDGNIGIGMRSPTNKIQISGGGISFTTSTGLAVQMIGIVLPTNIGYIGPYNSPADGNSPTVVALNHAASVQQTWFYSSGRIAMSLNREGRFHIGNLNNAPNCLLSVGPTSATTAVSGMCFGNDASANLYRLAAGQVKTDGQLVAVGGFYSSATAGNYIETLNIGTAVIIEGGATEGLYLGDSSRWLICTSDAACAANADGDLHFRDNANSVTRMIINYANGFVGIGATSPDTILTLEQDISTTAEFGSHGHFSVRGKTNTSKRLDFGFNTTTDVGFIQAMINGTSYNDLLLNANGGNVGIGVTSPLSTLHLRSTAPILTLGSASYPSTFLTTLGVDSSARGFLIFGNNGENQIRAGRTVVGGYLDFYTNNTVAQTTLASDGNFVMRLAANSNVGIGTTNPTAKLVVMGEDIQNYAKSSVPTAIVADSVPEFLIGSTDNIEGEEITLRMGSVYSSLYTHGAYIKAIQGAGVDYYKLAFGTSNGVAATTKMTIANDGKVGIGTVTPLSLLTVGPAGSISAASGITLGGDAVTNLYRAGSSAIRTDGALIVGSYLRSLSYIQLLTNIYADSYTDTLNINVGNTAANDWQTAIKIKPGSYVGIGTTNPTGKLHIVSSVAGETVLRADGTNGTLFSVVDDLSDSLMSVNNSAGLPVLEVFADDRVVAGQYGSGDFVLINNKVGLGTSNPTNKLTVIGAASIGSSTYNIAAPSNGLIVQGNVGIGTTSPQVKLHVLNSAVGGTYYGQLTVEENGEAAIQIKGVNYSSIYFSDAANPYEAGIVYNHSLNTLELRGGGNTADLSITSAGNVGIGITNPSSLLHLAGVGGDGVPFLRIAGTASDAFNWGSSTIYANLTANETAINIIGKIQSQYNSSYIGYRHVADGSASNMLTLGLYAADFLVNILGNGNVGIGLTNPSSLLHVAASAVVATLNSTLASSSSISTLLYRNVDGNSNPYSIASIAGESAGNGGYGSLIFSTAFNNSLVERMRINTNGNVGIGTQTPSGRLHVNTASYSSSNKPLVVNNGVQNLNTKIYDTAVIQQDDVTTLRLVERNAAVANQILSFSIGDGFARIACTAEPMQFYVNGGDAVGDYGYLGLNGTKAIEISTTANVGIGNVTPSAARLHIKGDGSNPVLRVETALLVAGTTTASKTFVGWMPMQTGALSPGDTVFIPLFK